MMSNSRLLYLLPYFGIELGFGEKTIDQVCADYGISVPLFLLVCNLYSFPDYVPNNAELKQIRIEDVVSFLQNSHKYYLEISMPQIVEKVLSVSEMHVQPTTHNMLRAFCDKYQQDVNAHIQYEEEVVFKYIRQLLNGEKPPYIVAEFESGHASIEVTLKDLRSIIIRYAPPTTTMQQNMSLLIELFIFEYNISMHARLESVALIPLMERLNDGGRNGFDSIELSERERQTIAALARGLSNKEIADKLNISIHTVVSHRKNIIRKTGIRTAQGLTLYAFINDLISQKDMR